MEPNMLVMGLTQPNRDGDCNLNKSLSFDLGSMACFSIWVKLLIEVYNNGIRNIVTEYV